MWRADFPPDHGGDGVLLVDLSVFDLRRTLLALKMAEGSGYWVRIARRAATGNLSVEIKEEKKRGER